MKLNIIGASIVTALLLTLFFIDFQTVGISENMRYFIGRFHPLVLHIPIGALVGVLVLEVIDLLSPKVKLEQASHILLWFTLVSIIPAIFAGLLIGSTGGYREELLNEHKNLGFATAFITVALLIVRVALNEKERKSIILWIYRVGLFFSVILLSLAGHEGGSLTHGTTYLTEYMPEGMKETFNVKKSDAELQEEALRKELEALENAEDTEDTSVEATTVEEVPVESTEKDTPKEEPEKVAPKKVEPKATPKKKVDVPKATTVKDEVPQKVEPKEIAKDVAATDEKVDQPKAVATPTVDPKVEAEKKAKAAALAAKKKNLTTYLKKIKPIMDKYCYSCHGVDKQRGRVRLDTVHTNFSIATHKESWEGVLEQIEIGEMPPEGKAQFTAEEKKDIIDWIKLNLGKN